MRAATQAFRRARILWTIMAVAWLVLLPAAPTRAVVGGEEAPPGSWPSMAALEATPGATISFCGGTLVAPRWVLTAAHCGDAPFVVLGRPDLTRTDVGEQIPVLRRIVHPLHRFVPGPGVSTPKPIYDVALLELATASPRPTMPMASPGEDPTAGAATLFAGWGRTAPTGTGVTRLRQAALEVVGEAACAARYSVPPFDASLMICALHDDAANTRGGCRGDSGGPLVPTSGQAAGKLVGVGSWGENDCTGPGTPGVYVRVSAVRSWVVSWTGEPGAPPGPPGGSPPGTTPPAPTPPSTTPPGGRPGSGAPFELALIPGTAPLATVTRRGAIWVRCVLPAAGRCAVEATISGRDAVLLGLRHGAPSARRATIARGTRLLRRGGSARVLAQLDPRARRALGRWRRSLTVRLAARGTAGGRGATAAVTLLLR